MLIIFNAQNFMIDREDENESYVKKFSKGNWLSAEALFCMKVIEKDGWNGGDLVAQLGIMSESIFCRGKRFGQDYGVEEQSLIDMQRVT